MSTPSPAVTAPALAQREQTIPRGMPRRPSIRPPPLDRPDDLPPTLEEFSAGHIELRLAFPLAFDGTTTQGLSALRHWMPDDWTEAMSQGRSTHPAPSRAQTIQQLLERGSTRVFPLDPSDIEQMRNRRSAYAHLHDSLPSVRLGAIDERRLERLVREYRRVRADLSSAMLSAHITELRFAVREAREEAGLRPLGPSPAPAHRRQGRRPHRPMATLEEVGRILTRGPRAIRVLVALLMATAASPCHLLRLTRGALDLENARLRVDTWRTRRPSSPEGHMIYGLPPWCVDLLRAECAGIDAWPPDRLLFPRDGHPGRPRRSAAHTFRLAADNAGCFETCLQDIRRLAQGIHVHAPRAVRRATATARHDDESLDSRDAYAIADAQEAYAVRIVRTWRQLMYPPVEPSRPPRRALARVKAHQPERPWPKMKPEATERGLPASCAAQTRRLPGMPAPAVPATPVAPLEPMAAMAPMPPPFDMAAAIRVNASTFGLLQHRAETAERALAYMVKSTMPRDEAYALALAVAMAAFALGMTVEAYLAARPALHEEIGERVGQYATSLLGGLVGQVSGPSPVHSHRITGKGGGHVR